MSFESPQRTSESDNGLHEKLHAGADLSVTDEVRLAFIPGETGLTVERFGFPSMFEVLRSDAVQRVRHTPDAARVCPSNPTYDEILRKAARNMDNPSSLGNLNSLATKFNCQMKSDTDAIRILKRIMENTGDPYNDVLTRAQTQQMQRENSGKDVQGNPVPAVTEAPLTGQRNLTLPNNIAYLKIHDFMQDDVEDELKAALERNRNSSALIIDLRDNSGGLVPNTLRAASLFVSSGRIMALRERADSDPNRPRYNNIEYELTRKSLNTIVNGRIEETSARLPDLVDKPVVILVNGQTASAAEIFTGALRHHGDATVMGTRTFGKGISQTIFKNMPAGTWLKVTQGRFLLPNGEWIGDGNQLRTGIAPDITVANPRGAVHGSAADAQLNTAVDYLTRQLQPHARR